MATAAYQEFDPTLPDGTHSGATVIGELTRNLKALRDNSINGTMVGWAWTPAGADLSQPDSCVFSKGTERIRHTFTWTSGKLTKVKIEYSSDSGATYVGCGTNYFHNITYDANGNATGGTWGAS